jgi:hypothetical protein
MAWYFYPLEFLAGALLANGVPHFVQGISGNWFQSPFAKPPGVGESSPVSNVLWGFANLAGGALLLCYFKPQVEAGWIAFGAGALFLSVTMARYFGAVRAKRRQTGSSSIETHR